MASQQLRPFQNCTRKLNRLLRNHYLAHCWGETMPLPPAIKTMVTTLSNKIKLEGPTGPLQQSLSEAAQNWGSSVREISLQHLRLRTDELAGELVPYLTEITTEEFGKSLELAIQWAKRRYSKRLGGKTISQFREYCQLFRRNMSDVSPRKLYFPKKKATVVRTATTIPNNPPLTPINQISPASPQQGAHLRNGDEVPAPEWVAPRRAAPGASTEGIDTLPLVTSNSFEALAAIDPPETPHRVLTLIATNTSTPLSSKRKRRSPPSTNRDVRRKLIAGRVPDSVASTPVAGITRSPPRDLATISQSPPDLAFYTPTATMPLSSPPDLEGDSQLSPNMTGISRLSPVQDAVQGPSLGATFVQTTPTMAGEVLNMTQNVTHPLLGDQVNSSQTEVVPEVVATAALHVPTPLSSSITPALSPTDRTKSDLSGSPPATTSLGNASGDLEIVSDLGSSKEDGLCSEGSLERITEMCSSHPMSCSQPAPLPRREHIARPGRSIHSSISEPKFTTKADVTRHSKLSMQDKFTEWKLCIKRCTSTVFIGDSNLARVEKVEEDNVEVHTYPGARCKHFTKLFERVDSQQWPNLKTVVVSVGLNDCLDETMHRLARNSALELCLRQAMRCFPQCRVYFQPVYGTELVNKAITKDIAALNEHIRRSVSFKATYLSKHNGVVSAESTSKQGKIHWSVCSANKIVNHSLWRIRQLN